MDLLDHIAAKIRDLRVSYNSGEGLSQESLATHLKVAPNTISGGKQEHIVRASKTSNESHASSAFR